MSFNLFEDPSIGGEWDLLGATLLAIFDIPFRCGCPWTGLWGVVILGITFRPTTVGMVHTAGGDTAFTTESTSEKENGKILVIIYIYVVESVLTKEWTPTCTNDWNR